MSDAGAPSASGGGGGGGEEKELMKQDPPRAIKIISGVAIEARRDSAEGFSRLKARRCTAMAWIFIPAHCLAIP